MVVAVGMVMGYPATVSLPHQDIVRGHKGKFTWAVPPKPILEGMLSRFFCASWGQTQRGLEPTLSPIGSVPTVGRSPPYNESSKSHDVTTLA